MAAPETSTAPLHPADIEKLRPGPADYEVADGAAPGLRLRVTRLGKNGKGGGAKVFRWYATSVGRVITIGHFSAKPRPGCLTLAQARERLERLKHAHAAGRLDEAVAELKAIRPKPEPAPKPVPEGVVTVREIGEKFLAHLDGERKRPEQARDIFKRDVYPEIGALALAAVTSKDVRRVVERVVARGSPVAAKRTLALVRQFFRWCVHRDDLDASPAEKFQGKDAAKALGAKESVPSDRVLSTEEIPLFWKAVDSSTMTPTIRAAVKLLLLVGVRSQELRLAEWTRVDFDEGRPEKEQKPTVVIPPEHMKMTLERAANAKPWTVPLGPTAVGLLKELQAFAKSVRSPFVLASLTNPGSPLSEKAIVAAVAKLFEETGTKPPVLKLPGGPVTPHDLRRSVRYHARQTLRVPFDVSEKLLGHSLGKIAQTYDPGDLLDERREAILAWDLFVSRLVAGEGATVVPIRKRKGVRS